MDGERVIKKGLASVIIVLIFISSFPLIKAKAKDINGDESDWGTLSVTMPNEPQFPFIQWLLERFPNAFPILRHLIAHQIQGLS